MTHPHPYCSATTKTGEPCRFRATAGPYCINHDPAQAERRSLAGKVRHPRFGQRVALVSVDGAQFERARVPTIAQIVDRLLDLEQQLVGCGDTDEARVIDTRRKLLVDARDTLWGERDRADEAAKRSANGAWQPGNDSLSPSLSEAFGEG